MEDSQVDLHEKYFKEKGRGNWIKSYTTLGTPHKGSTVTNVVKVSFVVDRMSLREIIFVD
jgi:triacylglycerol esterase/lipase EstA (alpha/beta hydrolase family)